MYLKGTTTCTVYKPMHVPSLKAITYYIWGLLYSLYTGLKGTGYMVFVHCIRSSVFKYLQLLYKFSLSEGFALCIYVANMKHIVKLIFT